MNENHEDPVRSGSCLCGNHHFQARCDPRWVAYCHCESCRRTAGAPIVTYAGFSKDRVSFDRDPARHSSSPAVVRTFCDRCGTPFSYESDLWPDEIHLHCSNFAEPGAFEPTRHVFFNEHEPDFDLYDDLPRYGADGPGPIAWGSKPAVRVLFLCTGNSARSILAESILNRHYATMAGSEGGQTSKVRGHSAGSSPVGAVNSGAVAMLTKSAYRLDRLRSKSWDEFTGPTAPPLDWVITLCDSAAREPCPVFAGSAEKRHWGLADPASGAVTFRETYIALEARINSFIQELGGTSEL